jgi:hypothetical protein
VKKGSISSSRRRRRTGRGRTELGEEPDEHSGPHVADRARSAEEEEEEEEEDLRITSSFFNKVLTSLAF